MTFLVRFGCLAGVALTMFLACSARDYPNRVRLVEHFAENSQQIDALQIIARSTETCVIHFDEQSGLVTARDCEFGEPFTLQTDEVTDLGRILRNLFVATATRGVEVSGDDAFVYPANVKWTDYVAYEVAYVTGSTVNQLEQCVPGSFYREDAGRCRFALDGTWWLVYKWKNLEGGFD